VSAEASPFSRSLVRALENTGYFKIVATPSLRRTADRMLLHGEVQFVLQVAGGLLAQAPARRAPGGAGRRRRHRPRGDEQRARRLQQVGITGLDHDLTGVLAA
jgi:ABC-2 type transport system permease protein